MKRLDHTTAGKGREFVKWTETAFTVEISEQDGKRTLKIFLTEPPKGERDERD